MPIKRFSGGFGRGFSPKSRLPTFLLSQKKSRQKKTGFYPGQKPGKSRTTCKRQGKTHACPSCAFREGLGGAFP
ncbi:MAG: hypothetical protein J6K72_11700, partial [Clostridia bacterium]|nr:hypothetical protein [Clostridia bacterium]